ncbi:ABC transporter permease subunit [Bacillus sp. FJAT-29953]|nr:ABC transporter permease subunit [Bacillus sp. FJAT-29953]
MVLFLLKKKRFVISVLFLTTLLTLSFLNTIVNNGEIELFRFIYDDNGNLKAAPPHPPFTVFITGTDIFGYNLGQMMIEGAKWTIGITFIVTSLRLLFSLVLSAFIYPLKPRIYDTIKVIFEPFSVVPQTIIAYFILHSVLWEPVDGFSTLFWQRALFETFILVIIAIPNLTVHLSSEMRLVEKEEFIEAAKTMGGSKVYLFFKHIVPHVYEKWILLFGQQFIQVLQLLAHLGFMSLFFGGTDVPYGDLDTPPLSLSYEWSGVIGGSISYLYSYHWMVLVPIMFFVCTALSMAFINDSLEAYFNRRSAITSNSYIK